MGISQKAQPEQKIETLTEPPKPPQKPLKTGISPKCAGRYYADAGRAIILDGEAYPEVMFVRCTPGVNGVTDRSDFQIIDSNETRNGRTPIPMDFEVQAWGQKVKGYLTRTLALMSGNEPVYHYHPVFERYVQLGSSTIREFDYAGYKKFLADVRTYMGGVHELVEHAGRLRVQNIADLYANSNSPSDLRYAAELEGSLKKKEK